MITIATLMLGFGINIGTVSLGDSFRYELSRWTEAPTGGDLIVHIVAEGENLFRIGLRYGVTAEAIREANDLEDNLIYVCQRLVIPLSD